DVLIVGAHGRPDVMTAPVDPPLGVAPRIIADVVPGCGPLGGIHAALTEARGDAVFVAACDMPYLNAAFVSFLLELAREADAAVPSARRSRRHRRISAGAHAASAAADDCAGAGGGGRSDSRRCPDCRSA